MTLACLPGRLLGSRPPRPLSPPPSRVFLGSTQLGGTRGDAGPRGTSRRAAPGDCGHPATRPPWSSSGLQGRCRLRCRGAGVGPAHPKGGASSAAPRRRFRLRSACGPSGGPVSSASPRGSGLHCLDFLSWGCQMGPQPCSPVPPLGGQDRRRSLPWVQGRAPGRSLSRLRGSRLRFPLLTLAPQHAGFAPPSASAPCSRHPGVEVATSRPGSGSPPAPPKGHAQSGWPGRSGCQSATPASRPRRFSRPRRCHRT